MTLRRKHSNGPDEARRAAELLELGDAFLELDRAWRIVRVNGRQELLSRKPRFETLGRVFWEVWPETAAPESRYWREYHRAMDERVPVQFEEFYAPLDMWTGVTAYPVSNAGIAIFFRDITILKRAEAAVREQEREAVGRAAELEAVLSAVAEGVLVYDAEGRIIRRNTAAENILGYDARLLGMPVAERLESAGIAWLREDETPIRPDEMPAVRAARYGETFHGVVLGMSRPDGLRWISLSASPLVVRGVQSGAVVSITDITERRNSESALRESERRLRRMIDANPIGVVQRDLAGSVRYANDAYLKIVRRTRADLESGRIRWEPITAPEYLPAENAAMAQASAHGASPVFEKEYVLGDGQRVPVLMAFASMGTPGEVTGFVLDLTDAKRAEAAIRESEARHRAFFQSVMEMAGVHEVVRDASGAVVDSIVREVNDPALALLGASRERVLGRRLRELLPRDVVLALTAPWRRVLETGAPTRYEVVHRGHTLLVSASRMAENTIAAVADDVTDRKRAEKALAASEARLRAIFEGAAVGIVEVDPEDRFVAVNARFCDMLGYRREELLGRTIHEITAPEDQGVTRALNDRARGGELRVFDYEKRYVKRDGAPLWVHVTVSIVRDAAGGMLRAIGTVEDIVQRKAAEDEVRSLAQFPTENPNPVLRATQDGRVLYANTPARSVLATMGWRDGAALPGPLLEAVLGVRDRGTIPSHDVTTPDGCVWSFTLSGSAGGAHVNLYGRDVTERIRAAEALRESIAELKRAQEALREADRRKDEFLGMLSHELRNPLAPIRNALYILEHAKPNGPQARRARTVASRQVTHLTRLVDDLLDVTRIARGKIELRRVNLDLAALVRRVAEDHRATLEDRHLSLDVAVADAPLSVNGDETRLAQVLGNVLHNAAKFTPGGGRVTVAATAEDGQAVIRIRDTGAGIEPGVLRTIFEPFTQAQQTLARSEGGLGLGLALVRGLVALHGGAVSASSAGLGRGTEFVVMLPVATAQEGSVEAREAARAPAQRRRVLVIDDNRDAADSLAELVAMLGHSPEVAYDGFAGLAKAVDEHPDVVLCDIGLPGMDGYEIARQLRARSGDGDLQLIALSGYAQPEDVARASEAGFDAHVAKPADPEKLALILGSAWTGPAEPHAGSSGEPVHRH